MRKLATALGCLVIAAYATVSQAVMHDDHDSALIARCHFGDQGYVIFKQRPESHQENTQKSKKRRSLIQQAAEANTP